jgi:sugar phosphate isomerase/epimerase
MRGGADPVEIIKKVGNRLMAVHQKDFSKTSTSPINVLANDDGSKFISRETFGGVINPLDFCEVGTGIMDIQSIIDAANEVGAEYIILEQDHTQLGQIESIKLSMENFKKYTGIEWE